MAITVALVAVNVGITAVVAVAPSSFPPPPLFPVFVPFREEREREREREEREPRPLYGAELYCVGVPVVPLSLLCVREREEEGRGPSLQSRSALLQ